MELLTCPFCAEADFDDVGLCLHLAGNCGMYDNACRRASDEQERRMARAYERIGRLENPA